MNDFELSKLQKKANDLRVKNGKIYIENEKLTDLSSEEEINEKYRFASMLEGAQGAICNSYLKDNWVYNKDPF